MWTRPYLGISHLELPDRFATVDVYSEFVKVRAYSRISKQWSSEYFYLVNRNNIDGEFRIAVNSIEEGIRLAKAKGCELIGYKDEQGE